MRTNVTVQQVCALAALTVRKHKLEGKNPIGAADLKWIFACNYEGTEQLRKIKTGRTAANRWVLIYGAAVLFYILHKSYKQVTVLWYLQK